MEYLRDSVLKTGGCMRCDWRVKWLCTFRFRVKKLLNNDGKSLWMALYMKQTIGSLFISINSRVDNI
jgi:hypothetical protein